MNTADPLVLQFASSRPEEVAELVAEYNSTDSAELIEALPADIACRVCASMPSRSLSELLAHLAPPVISQMLQSGKHADVITIVAHLHERKYPGILEATPENERPRLTRLFSYPEQTLSALASPDFIRVHSDTSCDEVATDLIASQGSQELPIFVVDEQGRYQGIVNTQAVISKRNHSQPVQKFMKEVEALPGDMPVVSAFHAAQWMKMSALAVVNADRRIVGAVTRESLARAANEADNNQGVEIEMVFSELAVRYLDLCANVISLVFNPPNDRGRQD